MDVVNYKNTADVERDYPLLRVQTIFFMAVLCSRVWKNYDKNLPLLESSRDRRIAGMYSFLPRRKYISAILLYEARIEPIPIANTLQILKKIIN